MFTSNYTGSDIDMAVGKVLDGKIGGMTEITYNELVELRNKSELIPGMQYRITDYMTTTVQENTRSAEHQFDIIVTADSTNILNEKARAIQHDFSESEEEDYFANSNLAAWELWYSLDNDEERFSWASNDPNKLDEIFKVEYTDNNNVPHITTTSTKKEYVKEVLGYGTNIDEYQGGAGGGLGLGPVTETYSPIENDKTKLINDSKFYTYSGSTHFEYTIDHYTADNVFYVSESNYFIAVDTSKSYELLLTPACEETAKSYIIEANKPVKWYNVHKCDFNGNVSNRKISNIFVPDTYRDLLSSGKSFKILSYDGIKEFGDYVINKTYNVYNKTGVIYRMIDEFNNDCPYDFKNIQFARWQLTNPVGYINDFDYSSWADDWKSITLSSSSNSFSVKSGFYGLDSSTKTHMFCDRSTHHKYKIEYTISTQPTYCYTFGGYTKDYSLNLDSSNHHTVNNVISVYLVSDSDGSTNKIALNNIVFFGSSYSNSFGVGCHSNTFGKNCCSNTFGNYCTHNSFGNKCDYNAFGNKCDYNAFGDMCYHNTFDNLCSHNIFGNNCEKNAFGTECDHNCLDYCCIYNIFDKFCESNSFGTYCQYNNFGTGSNYNSFNMYCQYNNFGILCYENSFGHSCRYNNFGNNCHENSFNANTNSFTFINECYYIESLGNQSNHLYINGRYVSLDNIT